VPGAACRASRPLRHRGRADRRALARRLHRDRRRRGVRADVELLRRRRREDAMRRAAVGVAALTILLTWLLPLHAQDTRLPPVFDGAAALRHVERLVAIGPRPAGSPALARARAYIVDELRRAGVPARVESFDAPTPHGRLPMANIVSALPGRRRDVIMIA